MDRQVAQDHDGNRPSRVIIRYRPGSAAKLRKRLQTGGNTVGRESRRIGAMGAMLKRGELRRLAADPDVVGISTDARIRAFDAETFEQLGLGDPTALQDVQNLRRTLGLAPGATGGAGVGVAIIDSGIAPMPDIASRITAFYDFTAGGVATAPTDAYGHGTHVAGLIAGSGAGSGGRYAGIAPQVRLIGLKVLNGIGQGYASDLLNAIEFAIDNRVALGIDVINLSLGHPVLESPSTDPLVEVVERASAAGIVVVASAGNFGKAAGANKSGFGGITSPGNAPSALTIGALRTHDTTDRSDDTVASYSSRGPTWYDGRIKPDVLAPGHGLVAITSPSSALYGINRLRAPVAPYLQLNGTSMAAAVASGVVSLMIEAHRAGPAGAAPLAPNAVKSLLQYTALQITPDDGTVPTELEQGAGAINAAAAVELAGIVDPTAAVGAHWLMQGVTAATTIGGVSVPWGQQVIWGDRQVWGESIIRRQPGWTSGVIWGAATSWGPESQVAATSLVTDSVAAWSTQIVWGTGLVQASSDDEHIVWGNSFDDEHIVWGNSFDDDHVVWGNSFIEEEIAALIPPAREQ